MTCFLYNIIKKLFIRSCLFLFFSMQLRRAFCNAVQLTNQIHEDARIGKFPNHSALLMVQRLQLPPSTSFT
ncbi:hypothetical protein CUMW_229390 [Citrus unshiu]|uniref:Secreted protein n=2 Tax=Citrus unshiu TaxID=55188 RepID=A0A2H5QI53_CITUN|nr:hypothetical protein CUMW_229390 [Citrus unshiu]